jgi:hypothetical protein
VPALKPKPFASGERLIPITELPEWAQPAFPNMKELNRVQVGGGGGKEREWQEWGCKYQR